MAQFFSIATQPDGKVLIGGYFTLIDGVTRRYFARLNANGSLDTSFEPGGTAPYTGANYVVYSVATQPDGKVLIGGQIVQVNGVSRVGVARLNGDGSLDTSFNPATNDGNYIVWSVVVQPDGKILIGGGFFRGRLNADGSWDTSFDRGSGPNSIVWSVALQPNGKVLIGGGFTQVNGVTRNRIARFNANGSLDTDFDPGSGANSGVVYSVARQADGKALIGGSFTQVGGVARNRIARLGGRTFVLAIGVNFAGNNALRGGNSAYAVAAGFARFVGLENVEVLELESSDDNNGDILTDRIRWLFDSANPQRLRSGDTLVLHINTHGEYEDYSGPGGEADEVPVSAQFNVNDFSARKSSSADEFLYLDNDTRIKDDTLQFLLSDDSPGANEVNKLFLVDACFAGGMFGSTSLGDSGDISVLPRTAVIAASPEGDYSFFDPVARIGWFSEALSKALTSMADSGATNLNFDALVAALTAQLADYRSRPGRISGIKDDWQVDVTGDLNPVSGKSTDFEWLVAGPNPPHLISAASRKIHGSTAFDINLPLTGTAGVECRSSAGFHTLVFTFTNDVVSGAAAVTSGTGLAGSPTFAGQSMTVNLSGVADVQKITVTLSNVTDNFAQVLPNTAVSVNMLVGDTTGNKAVNSSDVSQTKLQSGIVVSQTNCRQDVTANGVINSSDVSLVKLRSGSGLP